MEEWVAKGVEWTAGQAVDLRSTEHVLRNVTVPQDVVCLRGVVVMAARVRVTTTRRAVTAAVTVDTTPRQVR